jgi:hypothetical protein
VKQLALSTTIVALLATVVPTAALAKGASEAEIDGPGLSSPIKLSGSGEPGSATQLGQIAGATGFLPAVFGGGRDPQELLTERPKGTLGPRYTITYVMPGPNNQEDTLVQDVYPYAQPEAVTYTKPGQRFWNNERTHGGWYLSSWYLAASLKDQLVAAGLPPNAPTGDDGFRLPLAGILAAAVALALGGLAAYAIRRRPGTATAG